MKQAWLLSSHDSLSLHGYLLLLSMPDCSTVLHLSHDFSSASEPAAETIPYDLSSTTLAVACSSRWTIQITTENLVLVAQDQRCECQHMKEYLELTQEQCAVPVPGSAGRIRYLSF